MIDATQARSTRQGVLDSANHGKQGDPDMAPAGRTTKSSAGEAASDAGENARAVAGPADVEAPMSERDAPPAEPAAAGVPKITLKLAHPIGNPEHMRRLRLEERAEGYEVGDEVHLVPDDAIALINSGYAQVDPEDPDAVREALNPSAPSA